MKELHLGPGQLDVLAGCPPCQGFSAITTLNGSHRSDDPRNNLIFEFLRFVRVLRPKAIMMENVPGLARGRRIKKFLRELQGLGYQITTGVLDAADYGVPQRRKRFILMGAISSAPQFGKPARNRISVRKALTRLGARSLRDPLHTIPEIRSKKVRDLIRSIPKNGGGRLDLSDRTQLACHKNFGGFSDVYGRMSWDDVAPTITGGCCNPSKGRFLHPTKNRSITLREAALLQSFPRDYFFSLNRGKYSAAEMIGNALPPEFIRRHAIALRRAL